MVVRGLTSARGLAVAAGVPLAFVMLATLLAVASPAPAAAALPAPMSGPELAPSARALPELVPPTPTSTPTHTPTSAAPAATARVREVKRVRTQDQVAFITIDDGVATSRAAVDYVAARQLPVTAFLTAWTVKGKEAFFRRITKWGSIQNHSATHANLTDPSTDLDHELCYSQRALKRAFGATPWMLRPPYGIGGGRANVQAKAAACGIEDIVLWDAYVYKGKLATSGAIRPGSILLLHFSKNLDRDLKIAVRAIKRAGLTPASLADYLPAR